MASYVSILDGLFLIRMIANLPSTHGETVISVICKAISNKAYFVLDDYTRNTIKDSTREIRGDTETVISITGDMNLSHSGLAHLNL